jgi:dTMP kinase
MLITFEGVDGSGKSTVTKLVFDYLKTTRHLKNVIMTKEPFSKRLKRLILNNKRISNVADLFLFLADRMIHLDEVILPALEKKQIVLCDRYCDSTVAYQGVMLPNIIEQIPSKFMCPIPPDITFLLDLDTRLAEPRRGSLTDKYEDINILFHNSVRYNYLELSKKLSRIHVIKAENPIDVCVKEICDILDRFLNLENKD